MNLAKTISLVHLGLAAYGLLIQNMVLVAMNIVFFVIMDTRGEVDNLKLLLQEKKKEDETGRG